MKKIPAKIKSIILLTALAASFGSTGNALAQCSGVPGKLLIYINNDACPLTSSYQPALFNENNFAPGQTKTSTLTIKNNDSSTHNIGIKAANFSNSILNNDLARALTIVINNGTKDLYGGTAGAKKLVDFYKADEIKLGNLGAFQSQTYNITISLPSDTDNNWQEKTTSFDLQISFQGEGNTNIETLAVHTSGTAGVSGDRLLTAGGQKIWFDCSDIPKAYIQWQTNIAANSRILYIPASSDSFNKDPFDSQAPDYGYLTTNWEVNSDVNHSTIISNLIPGQQYAYRFQAISGPKNIITQRNFFTVACVAGVQTINEKNNSPIETTASKQGKQNLTFAGESAGAQNAREEINENQSNNVGAENQEKNQEPAKEKLRPAFSDLLASLNNFGGIFNFCFPWWLLIIFAAFCGIIALIRKNKIRILWIIGAVIFAIAAILIYLTWHCFASQWFILAIIALLAIWLVDLYFSRRSQ